MSDIELKIKGIKGDNPAEFEQLEECGKGLFRRGEDGVMSVLRTKDGKVDFIAWPDKTLVYVHSQMGHPAIYPLNEPVFEPPAEAILMDLDGTSVHSERFWVWIIERTTAALLEDPNFRLSEEDQPYVSGHSVSEHLQYCIAKYCPAGTVEKARDHYFRITHHEMKEILDGRGRQDAFQPAPGLKQFLIAMKDKGVKIALVTSGLYEKAWPEIVAAFRQMEMGDPLDFYDAIITAGHAIRKGQAGTLGELEPKPHPWLYAEAARVGLGIEPSRIHKVIGVEDSGAGVVSVRLAGFAAIGLAGGNIESSGVSPLLHSYCETLEDVRRVALGA